MFGGFIAFLVEGAILTRPAELFAESAVAFVEADFMAKAGPAKGFQSPLPGTMRHADMRA